MKQDALSVEYVKLHFLIEFDEEKNLPLYKASSIRGGIGNSLLKMYCIQNQDCDSCHVREECLVQKILYSKLDILPDFMSSGESVNYVIECEDYREKACPGDTLEFSIILFGKSTAYFRVLFDAVRQMGVTGLGDDLVKFHIVSVSNSKKEHIFQDGKIDMERYSVLSIEDYVEYRMKVFRRSGIPEEVGIRVQSPLSIKYKGERLDHFDADAFVRAVARRLYILGCYAGIENSMEQYLPEIFPRLSGQSSKEFYVKRTSYRKKQKMTLKGIGGKFTLHDISEELLRFLLAGELVHIGSNTSFGFGRYRIKLDN